MLTAGQILTLSVDKAAAGGRMIARLDGQVVLVRIEYTDGTVWQRP